MTPIEERITMILCQHNRVIRSMPSPQEQLRALPHAREIIRLVEADLVRKTTRGDPNDT